MSPRRAQFSSAVRNSSPKHKLYMKCNNGAPLTAIRLHVPQVGKVYSTKKCEKLAESSQGRVGWKVLLVSDDTVLLQQVYFYGKADVNLWLTEPEIMGVRKFRSSEWKRKEGAKVFRVRRLLMDHTSGCYAWS